MAKGRIDSMQFTSKTHQLEEESLGISQTSTLEKPTQRQESRNNMANQLFSWWSSIKKIF